MKTEKRSIVVVTSNSYGIQHASISIFFNGILCRFTFAESPKYFGRPEGGDLFELWGASAMLTAEGDGMRDTPRITADELTIVSNIGCYRVRPIKEGDAKKYGVNNWKGLFAEPVSHADAISEVYPENTIEYIERY